MKPVSIGLVAGIMCCAFAQSGLAAEGAKFTENVIYSFAGGAEGANPQASLINVKGVLYGTTASGGNTGCGYGLGCGTVFSLEPDTGAEAVLHVLGGRRGKEPSSGLIDAGGKLYGVTATSGAYRAGLVFAINRHAGGEKIVYSFCSQQNCTDGADPYGSLTDVNGLLYGTTEKGGELGLGTVFSIDPDTGAGTVLHSFTGGVDGAHPNGGLIYLGGTLYGTTERGGDYDACPRFGCGTVFALDPGTGAETVVYAFLDGADGAHPNAGLTDAGGVLYGTTVFGGTGCFGDGCGTVFSFDPDTDVETVLYAFLGGKDGLYPATNLIDVRGALYGTTYQGGTSGFGTVFSLDLATGAEKVVYSFCSQQNCMDGAVPSPGLIDLRGTLYGTTQYGGGTGCSPYAGCGTVFSLRKR